MTSETPLAPGDGRPLNVTMVLQVFPTTSETFILDQIVSLAQRRHRVSVVASRPGPSELVHPAVHQHHVLELVRYRTEIPKAGLQRALAVVKLGVTDLRRSPVRAATLRLLVRRHPGIKLRHVIQTLVPLADVDASDVYHCHFGPVGALVAEVREVLPVDAPLVTSIHGFDITSHVAIHGERFYDRLFARGDLLLPVSDHWRDRLLELGAPADRVRVHRMGVDLTFWEHIDRPPSPGRTFHVLSVGRFVEKKGFDDGLRAVAALRDQGVAVRYTLVGEGPLRSALQREASRLGLGESVAFVGALARDRLRQHLGQADVLLAPSRTASNGDQEGIPVVLMEAMATGMPVVASRHSGIPELVRNEESGLLADERDIHVLGTHLRRLAADPDLRVAIGRRARRLVERQHDQERLTEELVGHYRRVIAERARRRGAGGLHSV